MSIRNLSASASGAVKAGCLLIIASLLLISIGGVAAGASELLLSKLDRPTTLKAIVRSDNGKIVGMAATLGNSFLGYRAFAGRLDLRYAGRFEASLLPAAAAKRYLVQMDGAAVYHVENADQFLSRNTGRLFLPADHKPTFVTLKTGKYLDGGKATWICILSAPTLEAFYETRLGHERCDAFR